MMEKHHKLKSTDEIFGRGAMHMSRNKMQMDSDIDKMGEHLLTGRRRDMY